MSRFNLIDEKWIPVRFLSGVREELGIRDTLLRASDIAAIEDPSPPVVAALHRFLLAVLYRALEGPTDIDQAKALFRDGLPSEKITGYLEKWRERFWLFDDKYPFGQNPNTSQGEIEPWTKLTAEYNATSNKVLFDHTDAKYPGTRKPKECARWLLATMNFSISGGRGYYPSPSSNAMMCIPLGRELQRTLFYNLVPYPNHEVMRGDSALWEREPLTLPLEAPKRAVYGYADLYTWPSRMVFLQRSTNDDVEAARFVAGQGFELVPNAADPMQPYKIDKDKGRLPVQFKKDRGVWRDFESLLPDDDNLAPLTIQNALRLSGRKINLLPESVLVLGLRYEPPSANLSFWRMERFALPKALAGERFIRSEIHLLLSDAKDAQGSLWTACSLFARDILSRGERPPIKKDISNFVVQMPVNAYYWATLESSFHEVLREFTLERDHNEIRCQWLRSVRQALSVAWEQHCASVAAGDAWEIRAVVKAEKPVTRKLAELKDEILKLELEEKAE